MVLALDKNLDILACYKEFYKDLCINSIEFSCVEKAVNFFLENQTLIDLITTDITISECDDGIAFAQYIKNKSNVPIFLLSIDYPSIADAKLFSEILIKPFNPGYLQDRVLFWLARAP